MLTRVERTRRPGRGAAWVCWVINQESCFSRPAKYIKVARKSKYSHFIQLWLIKQIQRILVLPIRLLRRLQTEMKIGRPGRHPAP